MPPIDTDMAILLYSYRAIFRYIYVIWQASRNSCVVKVSTLSHEGRRLDDWSQKLVKIILGIYGPIRLCVICDTKQARCVCKFSWLLIRHINSDGVSKR